MRKRNMSDLSTYSNDHGIKQHVENPVVGNTQPKDEAPITWVKGIGETHKEKPRPSKGNGNKQVGHNTASPVLFDSSEGGL